MNHHTKVRLANEATARAHEAGALSMQPGPDAAAHRRRYWREMAASAVLLGHPWPAAEALGREPQ